MALQRCNAALSASAGRAALMCSGRGGTAARNRRIGLLERNHAAHSGSGFIALRDGESLEQAAKRLGISDGTLIVVHETLPLPDWVARARVQQAELVRNDMPP